MAVVDTIRLFLALPDAGERHRFACLLEFVRHGRVISGWQAPPADDLDDDGWAEDVPVYDTSDRSNDPWFPFAYTLELCQWFSYTGFENDGLYVSITDTQPDLLEQAIAAAPFPVEIVGRSAVRA